MTKDANLVAEYAAKIIPLLPLAKRAFGSRDTKSPQHDASREYTRLLVEFYEKEGSLLELAKATGVTYAGMRRRITTAEIPTEERSTKPRPTEAQHQAAVRILIDAKHGVSVEAYHETLRRYHEANYSMSVIASYMGLSSANPLYYGVNRAKLRRAGKIT